MKRLIAVGIVAFLLGHVVGAYRALRLKRDKYAELQLDIERLLRGSKPSDDVDWRDGFK